MFNEIFDRMQYISKVMQLFFVLFDIKFCLKTKKTDKEIKNFNLITVKPDVNVLVIESDDLFRHISHKFCYKFIIYLKNFRL